MKNINLTIDGIKTSGHEGMTILEAAAAIGIEIPRLCHQEGIKPAGNCRICVVEVKGSRTLAGSCHTPIAEGMAVSTNTPKVTETRSANIELMLTGHTGTCVTDPEARECTLHKLASDLEVSPPRFHVKSPRLYAAENISPYILRDMSKCILCRKCVRACSEIVGKNVYSMAYRSFDSKVVVDFDVPLNKEVCRDCGVCIEYCPTNALMWPEGVKKKEGAGKKRTVSKSPQKNASNSKLLDILEARQKTGGYISERDMSDIAEELNLTPGDVYGVASFYSFLSMKPAGKHVIRVCKSLPCYLKNAPMIVDSIAKAIGIEPGETTADGIFSFELTNCIGACDQAPAMLIDDKVYGNLSPDKITGILKSYREI